MWSRGIKYSLRRHAVPTALPSLYFVRCLSVYLLCFHMDLHPGFCLFHGRGQRNQLPVADIVKMFCLQPLICLCWFVCLLYSSSYSATITAFIYFTDETKQLTQIPIEAILVVGNQSSSCETTTSVHFTGG